MLHLPLDRKLSKISCNFFIACFLPRAFAYVLYMPSSATSIIGLRLRNSPIVPATRPILPPFFKYVKVLIVKLNVFHVLYDVSLYWIYDTPLPSSVDDNVVFTCLFVHVFEV